MSPKMVYFQENGMSPQDVKLYLKNNTFPRKTHLLPPDCTWHLLLFTNPAAFNDVGVSHFLILMCGRDGLSIFLTMIAPRFVESRQVFGARRRHAPCATTTWWRRTCVKPAALISSEESVASVEAKARENAISNYRSRKFRTYPNCFR